MTVEFRSHTCGALNRGHAGLKVLLAGWVHHRRDHGGLIFIDLRDRYGITQIIFRPQINSQLFEEASHLRSEWVISVKGTVLRRAPGMINAQLPTGEIEVEAHELTLLSKAKTPPFPLQMIRRL